MRLNKKDILINIIIAFVFLCILCITLYGGYKNEESCSKRGGSIVKTHNGYVCAKIEEIK